MSSNTKSFWQFSWRVIACHVVSYFIFGLFFSLIFNYKDAYVNSILSSFMKPTTSPWVAIGPSLQIIRGFVFALVLWPMKDFFINNKKGWLTLWLLFVGLAILGTTGPVSSSIEGLIYTKIPVYYQLLGLPEVLLQTFAFSYFLVYWYKHPKKVWNIVMGICCVIILLMGLAGVFLRR